MRAHPGSSFDPDRVPPSTGDAPPEASPPLGMSPAEQARELWSQAFASCRRAQQVRELLEDATPSPDETIMESDRLTAASASDPGASNASARRARMARGARVTASRAGALPSLDLLSRWRLAAEFAPAWDDRLVRRALTHPGVGARLASNPHAMRHPRTVQRVTQWLARLIVQNDGGQAHEEAIIFADIPGALEGLAMTGVLSAMPDFVEALVAHATDAGKGRPVYDADTLLVRALVSLPTMLPGVFDPLAEVAWLPEDVVPLLAASAGTSDAAVLKLMARAGAHESWVLALVKLARIQQTAALAAALIALPIVQRRAPLRAPLYAVWDPTFARDVWRRVALVAPDWAIVLLDEWRDDLLAAFVPADLQPVFANGSAAARSRALTRIGVPAELQLTPT